MDHWPLFRIFSKSLEDIRLREKLMAYNFSICWLQGKQNVIADALSWNLVDHPKPYSVNSYIVGDYNLTKEIKRNAWECINYRLIVDALKRNKSPNVFSNGHLTKIVQDIWQLLSLSDANLIILDGSPSSSRKKAAKGSRSYSTNHMPD